MLGIIIVIGLIFLSISALFVIKSLVSLNALARISNYLDVSTGRKIHDSLWPAFSIIALLCYISGEQQTTTNLRKCQTGAFELSTNSMNNPMRGGLKRHLLSFRQVINVTPAWRLFTQAFIQTQIKENIKAPRHWPMCGEFTGDRWIPRTNGQQRGKCFYLIDDVIMIFIEKPGKGATAKENRQCRVA